jgi:GT2 family glycosyltransferase
MDELTAVVLDWNLPAYTIRSVESLVDDGVPPHRIVVVENGPTSTTWTAIREALPSSVLVRVDRNVGFARANNLGARLLPGSAYLFCNNDAFVHSSGSVAALLGALEEENVALSVPRLLDERGTLQPSVIPFTTPAVAAVRASGLSRLIPNRGQPRWSTHFRLAGRTSAANVCRGSLHGLALNSVGEPDARLPDPTVEVRRPEPAPG